MKKETKKAIWMIVYWSIYLTATMAFFERFAINPHTVPGGVVGWTVIVELPRVILGFLISTFIFKGKRS